MMMNIALKLMYVGTAYHGWQIQKNAITVQEVLQKTLSKLLKQPIRCVGAGRTDAGVHAEVYIANFKAECSIPLDRLPLAVNALLPPDIVVVSARQVSDEFNAIGSCVRKEYTYRVYNSRIRNAFHVNRVYFYPKHLDEEVMARAAQRLVGTHDFRAMRDVGTPTRTTVRTCHYFNVERRGDLIELKVCADGFLYNQVRVMTGTVLYAAEGKLAVEDIDGILERGNRTEAGPTVPPDGLYMTKLWYREPVGLETDPKEEA
jgi:tRNA pseudouridine38-40 synthase